MSKQNAYIWAGQYHPQAVPLFDLKKGDKFVWPKYENGEVKIYNGRGWYSLPSGRKCRTGTKTAVLKK